MSSKSVLIFLSLVSLNVFAETSIDPKRSLADENIPEDFEDKPNEFHKQDRRLAGVKYGMTWGYRGYTPVAQETFGVHCYGTPTVPKYSPWNSADGGCNAYRGDTPCNQSLPILCISKCNYKRPCYSINCNPYAMNKEFYCGWSEGFIALSDPILGSQMTSRAVGDRICAAKHGANFVMAEHHDGKWVFGMDQNN